MPAVHIVAYRCLRCTSLRIWARFRSRPPGKPEAHPCQDGPPWHHWFCYGLTEPRNELVGVPRPVTSSIRAWFQAECLVHGAQNVAQPVARIDAVVKVRPHGGDRRGGVHDVPVCPAAGQAVNSGLANPWGSPAAWSFRAMIPAMIGDDRLVPPMRYS